MEAFLSQGFVYFSFGEPYLDETFGSIRTLLEHSPSAKICLITDEAGKAYWQQKYAAVPLDTIRCVERVPGEPPWLFKLKLFELSPYDKTLHLDGDIYVTADLSDLFDLLDTFDFVAVPDESLPARGTIIGLKGGYAALGYYNCGLYLFRKSPAVAELYKNWRREYMELASMEPGEQGALVRALVKTDLRFITLPKEYNLRLINKCASFMGRVKVIHGRARDPQKLIRMINDIDFISSGSRVWIPNLQRVIRASDFRFYGWLLRLFNLDNVQQAAHRRNEERSVTQNIAAQARRFFDIASAKMIEETNKLKPPVKLFLDRIGVRKLKPPNPGDYVIDNRTPHLGGNIKGGDPHSFDKPVFDYMIKELGVKSFFDCGSGEGHVVKYFEDQQIEALGLDALKQNFVCRNYVIHDLTRGPFLSGRKFDLVWCCEVAEHINAKYVHNFLNSLTENSGRFILMTYAAPGQLGYHHVNLKDDWYWIQLVTDRGFYFNPYLTVKLRSISQGKYFKRTGLVFERK